MDLCFAYGYDFFIMILETSWILFAGLTMINTFWERKWVSRALPAVSDGDFELESLRKFEFWCCLLIFVFRFENETVFLFLLLRRFKFSFSFPLLLHSDLCDRAGIRRQTVMDLRLNCREKVLWWWFFSESLRTVMDLLDFVLIFDDFWLNLKRLGFVIVQCSWWFLGFWSVTEMREIVISVCDVACDYCF